MQKSYQGICHNELPWNDDYMFYTSNWQQVNPLNATQEVEQKLPELLPGFTTSVIQLVHHTTLVNKEQEEGLTNNQLRSNHKPRRKTEMSSQLDRDPSFSITTSISFSTQP